MKRILLAAALSVSIHGYLLGTEPEWLTIKPPVPPKPRAITLTLTHYARPEPEPRPLENISELPAKKPTTRQGSHNAEPTKPLISKPNTLLKPDPLKKQKRKLARPIKQDVRQTVIKHSLPKEPALPPTSMITALDPEKEVSTITVPHVEPSNPPSGSESGEPEQARKPFELVPDIPIDVLKEPTSREKPRMASFPAPAPFQKASPLYRENPHPQYPRVARRRGYQGTTLLEVLVSVSGKARNVRVFRSSGYDVLDSAALSAVKGWLFEPGMEGKRQVEMWVRVPIRFELK